MNKFLRGFLKCLDYILRSAGEFFELHQPIMLFMTMLLVFNVSVHVLEQEGKDVSFITGKMQLMFYFFVFNYVCWIYKRYRDSCSRVSKKSLGAQALDSVSIQRCKKEGVTPPSTEPASYSSKKMKEEKL